VKVAFTAGVLAAATIGLVPQARAQLQNAPVDLELFHPAMDSKGFVTVNSSAVLGQWDLSFGLVTSYARRPLQFAAPAPSPNAFSVDTLVRPSLQAAVGFLSLPHLGGELGIIVPMGIVAGRARPTTPPATRSGRSPTRAWATSRSTPSCAS
jgi:hypothetical protein